MTVLSASVLLQKTMSDRSISKHMA
uniref:Uncharacterized protein n=1 Tax=Anguilla anguilla TaxID=7936 RepID=A0A0E9XYZ4_ANGAN